MAAGPTVDKVKTALEAQSRKVMRYAESHFLALNRAKTQILWAGSGVNPPVAVGDVTVCPGSSIEILGIKFDKHLTPTPHLCALEKAIRGIGGTARRLSVHLPQDLMGEVVKALLVGKISYGAAVVPPRLLETEPQSIILRKIQTSINDVARTIVGISRRKCRPVEKVLEEAGIPSFNRVIVKSVALEAWKAMNIKDGPMGSASPVGALLGNLNKTTRFTRSVAAGHLPAPTKTQVDTFIWHAYKIWNGFPLLRQATTLAKAKRAAREIAMSAPL